MDLSARSDLHLGGRRHRHAAAARCRCRGQRGAREDQGQRRWGGGAWLLINVGWGFAVMSGVFVGASSGAHINPAVTFGLLAAGTSFTAGELAAYLGGQMVGAFLGSSLAWLAYKDHFDATEDPGPQAGGLLHGPGDPQPADEHHHRGHRHLRARVRDPLLRPLAQRARSRCRRLPGDSASAPASVVPPATPSTRHVTSVHASPTPSSRSRARATATGATPGSRWSVRSSVASSPVWSIRATPATSPSDAPGRSGRCAEVWRTAPDRIRCARRGAHPRPQLRRDRSTARKRQGRYVPWQISSAQSTKAPPRPGS
jgi:hypothetical protein